MVQAVPPGDVTAIVNVGDDVELHGLHISPDLDTITYTVAGAIDLERGWGLGGETWHAMEALARYPRARRWFNLGDRDLATHLYRTDRLRSGASLSEVSAEVAEAWDLGLRLLPVTDDRLQTRVTVTGEGEIGFQEYFVERHHDVAVTAVRFDGAEQARPAPGVLAAIGDARRVVVAPSNPIVSIDPVLTVPGVRAAVEARRAEVVAGSHLGDPVDGEDLQAAHASTTSASRVASATPCMTVGATTQRTPAASTAAAWPASASSITSVPTNGA